jgi:transketolase
MGMFNTHIIEPADANQCDRIIRYVASHYGNFYVRMGRHALPVLTKPDGSLLYDKNYEYVYGETTVLQKGSALTIVASGPMIEQVMIAVKEIDIDAEIVIVSSPKKFDKNLLNSMKKTKKVVVVEDHNGLSGFASVVAKFALENNVCLEKFVDISPKEYQLSGTPMELYDMAEIGSEAIAEVLRNI